MEVHPEEDGVVQVVSVQTSKVTYKRPAVKIFQLDISSLVNALILVLFSENGKNTLETNIS